MSIQDKISELRQYRDDIRTIINDKGVDLPEGSDMSVYSDAIDSIETENDDIIVDFKIPQSARFNYRLDGFDVFKYAKPLTIPKYNGNTLVTDIGRDAFRSKQLTSVTFPDSLRTIGDSSFRENQLTSVYIPSSVTSISYSAFEDNPLTAVSIGRNTKYENSSFPSGARITKR